MTVFDEGSLPVDDPPRVRQAVNEFPAGVLVVAGLVDGAPAGLVISHFMSVSIGPPLVAICVAATSTTWPRLKAVPKIGISLLADDVDPTPLYTRGVDRFAGVSWGATPGGAVLIDGSAMSLECSIERSIPMGTHDLVVLTVERMHDDPAVEPLVWQGGAFRTLVPGVARELVQQEDIQGLMRRTQARTGGKV